MAAFSIRKNYLTDWTECKPRTIKMGLPAGGGAQDETRKATLKQAKGSLLPRISHYS